MLREEAARMEAILDRFVTLYRFPEPEPAELDIAPVGAAARGRLPGNPGPRCRALRCWCRPNRTLLEQALANLIQNAIDAMAGSDYGSVTVSVAGRPAVITVRDRGAGMTQEQQDRAFDDYYTTKESGMGVGPELRAESSRRPWHPASDALSPGTGHDRRNSIPVTGVPCRPPY